MKRRYLPQISVMIITLLFGTSCLTLVTDDPDYGKYKIPAGEKIEGTLEGQEVGVDTTGDGKSDIIAFITDEFRNQHFIADGVCKTPVTVFFTKRQKAGCGYFEISWISPDELSKAKGE